MTDVSEKKEQWVPGTEVVARFNFSGSSKGDLPFRQNDLLIIVAAAKDPNWYKARIPGGSEGMIPASYVHPRQAVELRAMIWYHGKIAREEAERLLHPRTDGLFLIRESVNYPGDFTLCVCFESRVEHYRVIRKNHLLTVDQEEFFENLTKLVEHYQMDADGLCTRLRKPLIKSGQKFFEVGFWNAFKEAGWSISREDLMFGNRLGGGEFGDVFAGTYRGAKVAIKTLKEEEAVQSFLIEAAYMTGFSHANLVRLKGVSLEGPGQPIFIVTEFLAKGSLVDYLRTRGRSMISQKDQAKFARDVSAGMTYLETKKFVHRDLAARNVLISEDDVAKVGDFGLARAVFHDKEGGKFPIKWTAPEALRHSQFSTKSDVWSFGVLLWELYSFGRIPYPRIPLAEVVQHIEKGYRMEAPDNCPVKIYEIMRRCWNIDAEKRPAFKALNHELVFIAEST